MKILFLSHYGAMLGANRSLLSMVQGLKAKGVKVMVYCPKEGGFSNKLSELNIPFEVIPYKNWADTFLLPGYWLLPFRYFQNKMILSSLLKKVNTFGPDLIHTNSTVLGMGAYIADQLQIPHVWHIREMAKLHYNMRFFPSTDHFYKYLSKAARCIVISEAVKNEMIGKRKINSTLVFNGVLHAEHFKSGYPSPVQKEAINFLIIGMLHPKKNQLLALQGFSKVAKDFPKARLKIVGTGRRLYEQQLIAFCRTNQIESQVEFAGYVSNPQKIYEQADVVLMCSEHEAMGRVTVEAMAYGKPVIGLRSGATPELIEDGKEGFLFDKNPENLGKHMRYFLENPAAIETMGRNGFKSAKEKFTIDTYVDKMYAIFASIKK